MSGGEAMAAAERYRDKVVLVTGGAGAIGSNLSAALAAADARKVIVLDDLSASRRWNVPDASNVLFVEGDVVDEPTLKRVFREGPDIVFHLAAFFANQNSVDYPERDLRVNQLGTLRLLEHATVYGRLQRFVYGSSGCAIYGADAPLPLREEYTSMYLSTPYQISKMAGELYCNFYWRQYELPVVKTRFFNSYGPGELPGQYRNVIPNFIYWAMNGQPLPITGDGEMTRDFTYVGDVVDALLRAGVEPTAIGREMNIASGREVKIADLANAVNAMTGNPAGIQRLAKRPWDNKSRLLASIDVAREVLGYEPATTFEDGLRACMDWFEAHWEDIRRDAAFGPGMSSAVPRYARSSSDRGAV